LRILCRDDSVTTVLALIMALLVHPPCAGGNLSVGAFSPLDNVVGGGGAGFHQSVQSGRVCCDAGANGWLTPPENGFLYDSGTALFSIMAMDVWTSVGYYMLIFLAGLQAIPDELYEAAEVAGHRNCANSSSSPFPCFDRCVFVWLSIPLSRFRCSSRSSS